MTGQQKRPTRTPTATASTAPCPPRRARPSADTTSRCAVGSPTPTSRANSHRSSMVACTSVWSVRQLKSWLGALRLRRLLAGTQSCAYDMRYHSKFNSGMPPAFHEYTSLFLIFPTQEAHCGHRAVADRDPSKSANPWRRERKRGRAMSRAVLSSSSQRSMKRPSGKHIHKTHTTAGIPRKEGMTPATAGAV